MRHYTPDSPQAVARVLALTILADGSFDGEGMKALKRHDVKRKFGIDDSGLDTVIREFCEDMMQYSETPAVSHYLLDHTAISHLLDDIRDGQCRLALLNVMLDIVGADGYLSDGETVLLSLAMMKWGREMFQTSMPTSAAADRKVAFGRRSQDRRARRTA